MSYKKKSILCVLESKIIIINNTIEIEFLTGLNDDVTKNGIQIDIKEFLGKTTYLSFNIKRSSAVYLHSFLSTYLQLND